MSRPLNRDQDIDAVLRRTPGRAGSGPAAGCPDADVLGAFVEGRLRPIERSTVEAHAADCDRCQAVLAALVRTEHVAGAASPPAASGWRRLLAPAWLVPATAVALVCAAAVAMFMVWRAMSAIPVQQAALREPTAQVEMPSASATVDEAKRQSETAPAEASEKATVADASRQATAPLPGPRRRDQSPRAATADRVSPVPSLPDADLLKRPQVALDADERAADPPAASPPAATGAAEPSAAPPPGVAPLTPMPGGASQAAAKASAEAAAQERLNFQPESVVAARSVASRTELVAPRAVLTPDPQKLWMLGPSSTVMRSTDGGRSFQPQPTNATAGLVAASAPSPDICWIVGEQGTVLLTTDGSTWRRVDVPDRTALLSVAATSALDAVVTAADGRTWSTSDGGRTWTSRRDIP